MKPAHLAVHQGARQITSEFNRGELERCIEDLSQLEGLGTYEEYNKKQMKLGSQFHAEMTAKFEPWSLLARAIVNVENPPYAMLTLCMKSQCCKSTTSS